MAQPVRKIIKEIHPEVGEEKIYTLLVDGNNVLRKAFTDNKINEDGIHYGAVFQFLLQLKIMLQKKSFNYVYVVFDDSESGILRYNLYHGYKANRDKHYENGILDSEKSEYWKNYEQTLRKMEQAIYSKKKKTTTENIKNDKQKFVDENFDRERNILMRYFEELFIRCIFNNQTEGDDLIAYYVKNKLPNEYIVIMSGDHDLTQLISDKVCIYDPNPNVKKFLSEKNFKQERGFVHENVVIKKIMTGDSSDNIKGINGLSEERLMELMPEIRDRKVDLSEIKARAQENIDKRLKEGKKPLKWHENIVNGVHNGEYENDFYETNRKLIDLSEPLMTDDAREEMDVMMHVAQDPEGRSFGNLYKMILEDNITDLKSDNAFSNFFAPFKDLVNKEIKLYKEQFGGK